jgi:SAM-dependent methyltransferase
MRATVLAAAAVVMAAATGLAISPLGRDLAFHVVPLTWTGEPDRLAEVVGLRPGDTVAEIGAGNGGLIVELARRAGPGARIYATERTEELRRKISQRAVREGVSVSVLTAPDAATNLPDACCDVVVLRMVWHHVTDARRYALDVRRALRPGGRVAIVDFAPGALPHLAADHGVSTEVARGHFLDAGLVERARIDGWGGRTFLMVFSRS